MNDETTTQETPGSVSVWVCRNPTHEDRQCFALVENTRDARIAHRAWHAQQVGDREALRGAIKERDEEIARYRAQVAEFRRTVAGYEETVAGLHGEVQRVETPVAPPAFEISRETHDDEQPELPDEDDWALPRLTPTEDEIPTEEDATAGEPAESGADDLDDLDRLDDEALLAPTPADVARTAWNGR